MPDVAASASPAPLFELPRHGGGTWSLSDQLAADARPVVLVFHRHIH